MREPARIRSGPESTPEHVHGYMWEYKWQHDPQVC